MNNLRRMQGMFGKTQMAVLLSLFVSISPLSTQAEEQGLLSCQSQLANFELYFHEIHHLTLAQQIFGEDNLRRKLNGDWTLKGPLKLDFTGPNTRVLVDEKEIEFFGLASDTARNFMTLTGELIFAVAPDMHVGFRVTHVNKQPFVVFYLLDPHLPFYQTRILSSRNSL